MTELPKCSVDQKSMWSLSRIGQALALIAAFVVVCWSTNNAYAEDASPEHPLKLIAEFEVPRVDHIAWFPDNRRLAIVASGQGVLIVDTVEKTTSPPVTSGYSSLLAVSPDGSLLAFGGFELTVLSTETWRTLGHVNLMSIANCRAGRPGFAFTPDSRFLWVGCEAGQMVGAIKLSVPDLSLVDKFEVTGNISPTSATEGHEVRIQADPLVLHVRTSVYPSPMPPPGNPTPFDKYFRAIDLATKADIVSNWLFSESDGPSNYAHPAPAYISPDLVTYFVSRVAEKTAIVAYEIPSRKKLVEFAPASEIATRDPRRQPPLGPWPLSNLIPLRDGRLIAAIGSLNWDGGLMIWNYHTGKLIQRLPAPGALVDIAISQDASRIAVGRYNRIAIYSLDADKDTK